MHGYWNHNAAYHGRIVAVAERLHGRVLDVGCGDGLLLARLAPVSEQVTGIDRDPNALRVAAARTARSGNVTLTAADFLGAELPPEHYDLVTFVAVLHHLPLAPALAKARAVLRPGGELFVVGLYATVTITDRVLSGLLLPVVLASGLLHREFEPQVAVAEPREGLAEIRAAAGQVLPGARLRRGVYYRYLLRWTKPAGGGGG